MGGAFKMPEVKNKEKKKLEKVKTRCKKDRVSETALCEMFEQVSTLRSFYAAYLALAAT